MQKVLDFLAANPIFQFATVDNGRPRCRPFGFHLMDGGRMYFITGEGKGVWRQLNESPYFELSVSSASGEWLRISGKAVFDTRPELVERAFETLPMLRDLYGPGRPAKAAMFYAAEAEAVLTDMREKRDVVKL